MKMRRMGGANICVHLRPDYPSGAESTSTVTPVDCVHTYASALAYVDGRPQGAQPLTYALRGIRVCALARRDSESAVLDIRSNYFG